MDTRIRVEVNAISGRRRYHPEYWRDEGFWYPARPTRALCVQHTNHLVNGPDLAYNYGVWPHPGIGYVSLDLAQQVIDGWIEFNAWGDSHTLNDDGTVDVLHEQT